MNKILQKKESLAIFGISLLNMAGMNIAPALQSIQAAFPEIPASQVQSLITLPSAAVLVLSLCAAWVAERLGQRRTLLLGSILFTAFGLLPAAIPWFPLILFSRVMVGAGVGLMVPLNTSLIFSRFGERERDTVVGLQGCASALGNIGAMLLSGRLSMIHYRLSFLVHLFGLIPLIFILCFLERDSPMPEANREKSALNLRGFPPRAWFWFCAMFLYMSFFNCYSINLSILVESQGIGNAATSGYGTSMLTVGSFLGGLMFGAFSHRLGRLRAPFGWALSGIGLAFMSQAQVPMQVYLAGIVSGLGMAFVTSSILVELVSRLRGSQIAAAAAVNNAMSNLGLSTTPYMIALTTSWLTGGKVRAQYAACAAILGVETLIILIMQLREKARSRKLL